MYSRDAVNLQALISKHTNQEEHARGRSLIGRKEEKRAHHIAKNYYFSQLKSPYIHKRRRSLNRCSIWGLDLLKYDQLLKFPRMAYLISYTYLLAGQHDS